MHYHRDASTEDVEKWLQDLIAPANLQRLSQLSPYKELLAGKGPIQFDAEKVYRLLDAPRTQHQLKTVFAREQLSQFLTQHQEDFPRLSPALKHELSREIDATFVGDTQKAAALKKVYYPERSRSILLTTLALFGYVGLLARVVIGLAVGVVGVGLALCRVAPPTLIYRPAYRAFQALGQQVEKDMTRLMRAFSKQIKVTAGFLRTIYKSMADVVVNSLFARPVALFLGLVGVYPHHISNFIYSVSGWLDTAYEKLRQLISVLVDALVKRVTTPHASDARNKVSLSVVKVLQTLGVEGREPLPVNPVVVAPVVPLAPIAVSPSQDVVSVPVLTEQRLRAS